MIAEMKKKIAEAKLENVEGVLVARKDGVEILSTFESERKKEHLAPITAAVIGSSEIFLQSSGVEVHNVTVMIESDKLNAVMAGEGKEIVIAVLTKPGFEAFKLIPRIRKLCKELTMIAEEEEAK